MFKKDYCFSFGELRNQLINDVLLGSGIAAIPGLTLSLWRVVILDFHPLMLVHTILVVSIWSLWIGRKRLSYTIRAGGLLLILWIATFAALFQLGPVSDSKVFMVLFAFTSILFLKQRTAWLLIGIFILNMGLFGYAAVQHWLVFNLDYQNYAHHPSTWMITIWNMGVYSSILAYIGWRMVQGLQAQSETNAELAEHLQKISGSIPGVVYQLLLRPDGSAYIPYASDAIQELFRVTPDQVSENTSKLQAVLHPEDLDTVISSIQESSRTLTPWQLEYRVRFNDGTVRWHSGSAIPQITSEGGILWHGVITDISDYKNAQQLKDEFVATVSHELRTPLSSINGAIKLINSGVLDAEYGQQKEMLSIVETNTERLLYLVNELLDFEKLEKGSLGLQKTKFHLKPFINECIAENQSYAEQFSTNLQLKACNDLEINADKIRLKQVISNLISNACKFSPPGKPVEITATVGNGMLHITVTDHGPGIPKIFHEKIFEKFIQVDSSNTRKIEGVGLGLSIVKQIVEMHGGTTWFDTADNVGTTFNVRIPL
ncbi:MAG: PAS domain-containing protein [Methyloprofundus sp.]|nr:PAS domain-containing protein [Methyloprofundus sp.]